ncbi:hypothetical protein BLS_007451 [Venturia inaequalis]|uniref:BZIP domain-containing protein n=2 Tax=Venturia inaequalis TaxID=5025 RepID=A0A8H3U8H7_VENIN|nr:hypothetical protein BLS_007451 [Venturia inaequalis]KAE9985079.1 hypothetical protein EG328_007850 [Venturia inaequalis]
MQDSINATMFAQNPFDTYRFSSGLPQDDLTSAGDGMPIIGSLDSGLGNDGMGNDGLDFFNQGENSYQHDRRSSSEEKDNLTPAQSRRKAQNRAAQRAFRERKERHVKDLEAKLNVLESSASSLASDNQRLKLALQRATTENEILRASSRPSSTITPAQHHSPMHNIDTSDALLDPGYTAHSPAYGTNDGDGALLPAGATWDLIQNHPLVRQGFIDIADVCDRLRGAARCDGSGPVFAEKEVIRAVESSRRAGGDELI